MNDQINKNSSILSLLSPIFRSLGTLGCDPTDTSRFWKLKWTLFFTVNLMWTLLFFAKLIHFKELEEFGQDLFNTYAFYQMLCKFLVFFYYKDVLINMIQILTEQFWTPEYIGDRDLTNKYQKRFNQIRTITKWYIIIFVLTSLAIILDSVVKGKKTLPMDIWYFGWNFLKQTPYYEILYILQCITAFHGIVGVVAMLDILYFVTVSFGIMQFEVLNRKLRSIDNIADDNELYKALKECVDQHNHILEYMKKIEQVFQFSMVNQLIAQVVFICLTNYLYLVEPASLSIKLPISALASVSQTFLYCLSGELVTDQSTSVGVAVYNLQWNKKMDKRQLLGYTMMIQRSQKGMTITIGAVMELSLLNFITIVKAGLSYYIFLKNNMN